MSLLSLYVRSTYVTTLPVPCGIKMGKSSGSTSGSLLSRVESG